uniref:ubiquitinyl hydrolase 1 n=1 Tax=Aureoumbra lagunensis TaxID=44058 RepID=A0A6S8D826_9STRA
MLRRGCTPIMAKQVRLALKAQLATFCARDVARVAPDQNGRNVIALVAKQLAYSTAKLADRHRTAKQASVDEEIIDEDARFEDVAPEAARRIAERLLSELEDVPEPRDAAAAGPLDLTSIKSCQFRDALAWRVEAGEPDPGQAVLLRKYLAIDALQIPSIATTRDEAIAAIRHCDRICSLIDNQPHAIKNDKLLILALIQHTLTCVVPTPRPRHQTHLYGEEKWIAERAERRRRRQEKKKAVTKNEKSTAQTKDEEEDTTDFTVGTANEMHISSSGCIWDDSIDYATQVELLLSLRRLIEHFTAAVLSTQQDRALDAVCLIIPGIACAISDAVLRRRAYDHPSSFCAQLNGQTATGRQLGVKGYGLSVGSFASQTNTIEAHVPELAIARAAVLDYFLSPAQRGLEKIFTFEERYELRPGKPLIAMLRSLCREVTLATPNPHLELVDALPCTSNLAKNFPELAAYRDVAFFWKYFQNPDRTTFFNYVPTAATDEDHGISMSAARVASAVRTNHPRRRGGGDRGTGIIPRMDRLQTQLTWGWTNDEGGYSVSMSGKQLRCRPDPSILDPVTGRKIPPELAPKHRFPSRADPESYLLTPPPAKTEDDILYRPQLPGFSRLLGQRQSAIIVAGGRPRRGENEQSKPSSRNVDAPALGQRDAELLLSYMTVPYIRLPLVLTFFASDDRVHKLESPALRGVLDAVFFEPGRHLGLDATGVAPATCPTPHKSLLATAHGHLLSELRQGPRIVVNNVVALLRGALALDTGAVCDADATDFNASVVIILYATRLGARLESFLAFLRDAITGNAHCANANKAALKDAWPVRDLDPRNPHAAQALEEDAKHLRAALDGILHVLDDYLAKLDAQTRANPGDEALVDRNSRLACDLHAHKLLIHRNATNLDDDNLLTSFLGSFLFLTTRHTFNKAKREDGRMIVPEFELYELLQHVRRPLVSAMNRLSQSRVNTVMTIALSTATSCTGHLDDESSDASIENNNGRQSKSDGAESQRWCRIKGERSIGRFTAISANVAVLNETVIEVADSSELDVEIDLQIGQLTLRSKHLAALDSSVANSRDVRTIFGDATIQASLSERSVQRQVYRLVGLEHEVEYWHSPHVECLGIPESHDREYDPAELFDSESWLPRIFEPVRRSFFDGPTPPSMQFLMPSQALPADAEHVVLLGLHQRLGGVWKRIVVFRRRRCVHVYELTTRAREFWWSLHLTTDARFCLAALQPSAGRRALPFPEWWKRGAGEPYPCNVNDSIVADLEYSETASVLIRRDASHPANLSGGVETYIPPRLLHGLIPQALLDDLRFWRDESRGGAPGFYDEEWMRLRGYPLNKEETFSMNSASEGHNTSTDNNTTEESRDEIVFVELGSTGISRLNCVGFANERSVRISRRTFSVERHRFEIINRVVECILKARLLILSQTEKEQGETTQKDKKNKLLSNKSKKKLKNKKKDENEEEELVFREGAEVEWRSTGGAVPVITNRGDNDEEPDKERWLPCEIVRVDYTKRTYDLEFSRTFSYLGIQRGIKPSEVAPRGSHEGTKAQGEGKWRFQGMSDSEDEAWREDDSSESDEDGQSFEEKKRRKVKDAKTESTEIVVETLTYEQREVVAVHIVDKSGCNFEICERAITKLVESGNKFSSIVDLATALNICLSDKDKLEDDRLYLLDLLYAPRGSTLASLASVLSRIENLSHICAWTKESGISNADVLELPSGCPELTLIELPRLKLAFSTKRDHSGKLRLFSVDHVDLYVEPDQRGAAASGLMRGIDHSLLLANKRGEQFALVPVIIPKRPFIRSQPFSTALVLDREGTYQGDYDVGEEASRAVVTTRGGTLEFPSTRFFLYSIHVSLAFVLPRGLASALYLLLLRLLKRDYSAAFRLCDSVASDVSLSPDELAIFYALAEANDDRAPDAHAVRLKISLVTGDSGHSAPWDLTTEMAKYIAKLDHVSATCRLPASHELRLLESEKIALDEDDPIYDPDLGHEPHALALNKNRRNALRAALQGEDRAECVVPPREKMNETPWPLYTDETCFGIAYSEMRDVSTVSELSATLASRTPMSENTEHIDHKIDDNEMKSAVQSKHDDDDMGTCPVPPGGWLSVITFSTTWSTTCASLLPSVSALAPSYPSIIFINVRVDADPLLHEHAILYGVEHFPSFVIKRGDTKVSFIAVSSSDESKALVNLINQIENHLTEHDIAAYTAWRRRERFLVKQNTELDSNISGRQETRLEIIREEDDLLDDEDEDDGEVLWTWDVDAAAEGLRIEALGTAVTLPLNDDDLEDDKPVWEYTRDDGRADWRAKWTAFPDPQTQTFLEISFLSGKLYREQSVTDESDQGGLHIYFSSDDLEIESYIISGFKGYMTSDYEDIRIRRKGTRIKVPGEEPFVSKRQEAIDKRNEEWRSQYDAYLSKQREARRGRDCVAARGTAPLQKDSGTHRWTLEWRHIPGAQGTADGVGLIAEGSEAIGPCVYPCLGGPTCDGASLGLHANGDLWVSGSLIQNTGITISDGTRVTILFDTSGNGTIKFYIDSKNEDEAGRMQARLERIDQIEAPCACVDNVFNKLACTECYPAVSMCPLDLPDAREDPIQKLLSSVVEKKKTTKKKKDETETKEEIETPEKESGNEEDENPEDEEENEKKSDDASEVGQTTPLNIYVYLMLVWGSGLYVDRRGGA